MTFIRSAIDFRHALALSAETLPIRCQPLVTSSRPEVHLTDNRRSKELECHQITYPPADSVSGAWGLSQNPSALAQLSASGFGRSGLASFPNSL